MNMKQFRYVLVLADVGSFSKAADELNISQPSLSQYVKKIETQLGVELFDRTNGYVRLTDAGKVYIDAGRKILELEKQMEHKFADISEHKIGSITVGTTPFRSVTMMPAGLAKFKELYPGMHIVIDERETSELREAGEKGEFDLFVLTLPVDEKKFDYELIMEEEIVIAVPKNSEIDERLKTRAVTKLGCRYQAVDFGVLKNQEFVMLTDMQIMQCVLNNLCMDSGIELQIAAVVKSLEAQIEMVRAGVGAALVPTGVCKTDDDKVNYYSLLQDLPSRRVVVAYRKGQYLSRVEKEFIQLMKSLFIENNAK